MKKVFFLLTILCSFSLLKAQQLYSNDYISTIEIYFSENNWNPTLTQMYMDDPDAYLLADSVIINGSKKDSVGVKYKGNSTFNESNSKNPFNIALDEFVNNQDHQGFRTLKLSSGKNDPSFLREVLSYEIARKYMQAPQSNYTKLFVNDNFHGLYVNSESINSDFQRDYLYSDNDNTRLKCNPISVFDGNGSSLEYLGTDSAAYQSFYELKTDYSWQDLINLCNTIENNPNVIENTLNIDRAIWMLAFNNVLVNLDSYLGPFRQNYYLIKDDLGKMNTIVWDLNESFGGFSMVNSGGGPPQQTNLAEVDLFLRENDSEWPLINLIYSNPTYRRMYVAHVKTILQENFSNDLYKQRAQELQDLIKLEVQSDPNALYSYNDFLDNLNTSVNAQQGPGPSEDIGIVELMDARADFLEQQTEINAQAPVISSVYSQPLIINDYSSPTIKADISGADKVILGYRYRPSDHFTKVEMYDNGMNNDGAAGDGTYGVSIDVLAFDLQYYIYAENQQAGIFSPERAEHEFHNMAVVGDLVINELMASNVSAVVDPSNGFDEYDDWVEIYNRGDVEINLNGFNLSDREQTLNKWQFPDITIQPDQYLIVWLDGDDQNTEGLHASFKLSASEEALFLSTPNEFIVDAIFYEDLPSDLGYARLSNGSGSFVIQDHTFNANNGQLPATVNIYDSNVSIYPNPASDYFIVDFDNAKNLEVVNLLGKSYFKTSNIKPNTIISTSSWPSGIYLIRVDDVVKKLIIQ
ncbi:MAG: CotH kinase family protein [Flavobacteriales bacterium]